MRLEPDEQLSNVVAQAKRADLLPSEIGLPEIDNYLRMHKSRREVLAIYVPQSYRGRITLLRTEAGSTEGLNDFYGISDPLLLTSLQRAQEAILSSPMLGWEHLSEEALDLYFVPGHHHSMLFEPDVAVLAARLGELIDNAEERAARTLRILPVVH